MKNLYEADKAVEPTKLAKNFNVSINLCVNSVLSSSDIEQALLNFIGSGNLQFAVGGTIDDCHIECIDADAKYILYPNGLNSNLEQLYDVYRKHEVKNVEVSIDSITLEDAVLNYTNGNHIILNDEHIH